jgi:hypothetical protein
MRTIGALLVILAVALPAAQSGRTVARVLIIMDEREQMDTLARFLKDTGGIESTIVDQKSMPEDWSGFGAVIGYVHGTLQESTELKIIDYTKNGGRYVCLHHSISSGKAKNKHYFDFLGVQLPGVDKAREPSQPGDHYAWREPVTFTVVNINPDHYITKHNVKWPEKTSYRSSDRPDGEREYAAFTLEGEAYMNHQFTDGREKTLLLGMKYLDDRNGVLYMQDREGWLKPSGKGWIVYLQMGHATPEFRNPAVAQLVLNAVTWAPGR